MKTKIIIGILILFLTIGIVCATDINNLKCPDGWKAVGGGSYHEEGDSPGQGSGRNMMIQKYDDSFKEDFFNNVSSDRYYVFSNGDNTFNYSDAANGDYGCFEVVEINGEKYFVNFWNVMEADFDTSVTTYDLMLEFNKLNNFKPIEV